MKTKKALKLCFFMLPVPIALMFVFREQIIRLSQTFPKCIFYALTGYYCPACGNTRSVLALINGNILVSLHYNIVPVFLFLVILCFYIENAFSLFGRKIIIFPRSDKLLYSLTGFFVFYFIIRNFIPFLRF